MKQIERTSIMRMFSDLIKADSIIDTREISFLESIREKYGIKKEDEVSAFNLSLSDAVNTIRESQGSFRQDLIGDLMKAAMADNYCAREEALLIVALRICFNNEFINQSKIISVDTSELFIEPTQILYVESEFDNDINWEINENYRALTSEVRLAGFDFVYLPKIAEHYRSIPDNQLINISSFLYPYVSEDRLRTVAKQLRNLSTSEFCKDQLAAKLGVKEFNTIAPSLLVKIGDSLVNEKKVANFLIFELDKNVIQDIREFLDLFGTYYHTFRLNYLKEEKGRFIFTGFYKQVFDVYMLRKGVKSSVVIDVYRDQIRFPEADMIIEKLHRREKALYALFLLESASGGINFTKPDTPKQLERYEKRIAAVQKKYRLIYKKFGGEPEKAPDLSVSEIRLPMIALIKKRVKAMGEVLYNVDDYTIQRNIYGNYGVNIHASLCCCSGVEKGNIMRLTDSEDWQIISAL